MFIEKEIKKIESLLNYSFNDKKLLFKAFTHSSYANIYSCPDNERLEFLGDSILGFITTIFLYENFAESEGALSKLKSYIVSTTNLAIAIDSIGLHQFIRYGKKGIKSLPSSIKANLFEAIVGAIYMDKNLYAASEFILKTLNFSVSRFEEIMDNSSDYKTILQELIQTEPKKKLSYKVIKKTGPPHNPIFTTHVKINNKVVSSGTGPSKKESENKAAKSAIIFLKNKKQIKST